MEIYKEILAKILENQNINVFFPDIQTSINEVVESKCYEMLSKIRRIIRNPELSDKDCFDKIEEIVCVFEQFGISSGIRHDL